MTQTKPKCTGVATSSPSRNSGVSTTTKPVDTTPNPKPHKTHRLHTSAIESLSRPSFTHTNPNTDYEHKHGHRIRSTTQFILAQQANARHALPGGLRATATVASLYEYPSFSSIPENRKLFLKC
ncbi:hypothetical protein C8R45DRAFT_1111873 [Mycena sanguinolenta]|nr:hypothetical protein C8R45DRAFT_1111873 [Mycena sanguinolenta]